MICSFVSPQIHYFFLLFTPTTICHPLQPNFSIYYETLRYALSLIRPIIPYFVLINGLYHPSGPCFRITDDGLTSQDNSQDISSSILTSHVLLVKNLQKRKCYKISRRISRGLTLTLLDCFSDTSVYEAVGYLFGTAQIYVLLMLLLSLLLYSIAIMKNQVSHPTPAYIITILRR